MERLLDLLPSRPQPLVARWGVTALLVAVFFVFRLGAGPATGPYSFIFFIPPILLAAILFDHGSGAFAMALSVLAVSALLDWHADPVRHAAALTLFVIVSSFIVVVGEGMRTALERLVSAQAEARLLLQEQAHRTKNDLAIATSLIRLQGRAEKDNAVRAALDRAAERLNVLAKGHDYLRMATGDQVVETIDMQEYLGELCWSVGERLRDLRPIAVEVDAERVVTNSRQAIHMGLIVNELVTNALKHAFPGNRAGTIAVKLNRCAKGILLTIEDNGIGCPDGAGEGLGSRLTQLLVQQLRGTMTREATDPGCRILIEMPATDVLRSTPHTL